MAQIRSLVGSINCLDEAIRERVGAISKRRGVIRDHVGVIRRRVEAISKPVGMVNMLGGFIRPTAGEICAQNAAFPRAIYR